MEIIKSIPKEYQVEVTSNEMKFEKDLTFSEFTEVKDRIVEINNTVNSVGNSVKWWLGSLINYAEARYGEKYSQVLDCTDYKLSFLKNCCYVESRVPPENRLTRPDGKPLEFCFHTAVARIDPSKQKQELEHCMREGLNTREFLAYLNDKYPFDKKGGPPKKVRKTFDEWAEEYWKEEKKKPTDKILTIQQETWDAAQENK